MTPALLLVLGLVTVPVPAPAARPVARVLASARGAPRGPARAPGARASSVYRPVGGARHDPALVLDGDPRTAWCEGAPGVGIGEWIEVRPRCAHGKGVCKVAIENGWGRGAETWATSGRVSKLRFTSCVNPGDGTVVDVRDTLDRQEFRLDEPLPGPACVRLVILGARSGRDGEQDVCLSEVIASCVCEPRATR